MSVVMEVTTPNATPKEELAKLCPLRTATISRDSYFALIVAELGGLGFVSHCLLVNVVAFHKGLYFWVGKLFLGILEHFLRGISPYIRYMREEPENLSQTGHSFP